MRSVAAVCAVIAILGCGPVDPMEGGTGGGSGAATGGGGGGTGGGGAGGGGGNNTGGGGGAAGCSAANCPGCCFNNICQSGNTAAACGRNAATCVACGTGTTCKADQTCGIDPEKLWEVHPASATISMLDETGSAWDAFGGLPDPFVNLYCPSSASTRSAFSPSGTDTLMVTWMTGSCVMKTQELLTAGFAVEVFDEDVAASDPISARQTVTVTEAQLLAGSATVTNGTTLVSMGVQLTPR